MTAGSAGAMRVETKGEGVAIAESGARVLVAVGASTARFQEGCSAAEECVIQCSTLGRPSLAH
jgi:hypothetical protein